MLLDLIRSDHEPNSPLQAYIRNMMSVMLFDAERRGRLISGQELSEYTRHLAVAVTEALHYFIGHDDPSPQSDDRYCAVTAAHITHLLRDTYEDVAAGYFNIPQEFLESRGILPDQVQADAYREWVKSRVQLARANFRAGRDHLARVKSTRCRLAGYAYMARFEGVLDAIEQTDYRLLPQYARRSALIAGSKLVWSLFTPGFLSPESGASVTSQTLQSH
jgi:phytoene/squalene synthetase